MGVREARKLCEAVAGIPDAVLTAAISVPKNYASDLLRDVPGQVRRVREKAVAFLAEAEYLPDV